MVDFLEDLPIEILFQIIDFLPFTDKSRLSRSSSFFFSLVRESIRILDLPDKCLFSPQIVQQGKTNIEICSLRLPTLSQIQIYSSLKESKIPLLLTPEEMKLDFTSLKIRNLLLLISFEKYPCSGDSLLSREDEISFDFWLDRHREILKEQNWEIGYIFHHDILNFTDYSLILPHSHPLIENLYQAFSRYRYIQLEFFLEKNRDQWRIQYQTNYFGYLTKKPILSPPSSLPFYLCPLLVIGDENRPSLFPEDRSSISKKGESYLYYGEERRKIPESLALLIRDEILVE